jgi:polyisoprenoid-binding protein YceI
MTGKKGIYAVSAVALLAIGAVFGVLSWQVIRAGSGEASEEISAPTLDIEAGPTFSQAQAEAFATENAELRMQIEVMVTESANENATAIVTEESMGDVENQTDSGKNLLYRISQEGSEVRFNIDETLSGSRITVVGVTDQVAGDIIIDFDNPSSSRLGVIRINVRTLRTDQDFRNIALRSDILESARDEYEFAEFHPVSINSLPDTVAIGDDLVFQITGDLVVHGVTQAATFETNITLVAEDRIEGYATATILYSDFNISIPSVPRVADVSDEVILEIDFVATIVTDTE